MMILFDKNVISVSFNIHIPDMFHIFCTLRPWLLNFLGNLTLILMYLLLMLSQLLHL